MVPMSPSWRASGEHRPGLFDDARLILLQWSAARPKRWGARGCGARAPGPFESAAGCPLNTVGAGRLLSVVEAADEDDRLCGPDGGTSFPLVGCDRR